MSDFWVGFNQLWCYFRYCCTAVLRHSLPPSHRLYVPYCAITYRCWLLAFYVRRARGGGGAASPLPDHAARSLILLVSQKRTRARSERSTLLSLSPLDLQQQQHSSSSSYYCCARYQVCSTAVCQQWLHGFILFDFCLSLARGEIKKSSLLRVASLAANVRSHKQCRKKQKERV